MSEKFEVGEVAIFCREASPKYGAEVTVTGALHAKTFRDALTGEIITAEVYRVSGLFGTVCQPKYLRKKPPHREDHQLVKWSECPWQPSRERA